MLDFRTFARQFPSTEVIRKHWPADQQPKHREVVKLRKLINQALFAAIRGYREDRPLLIAKGNAVVWRTFRAKNGKKIRVSGIPEVDLEIALELRRVARGVIIFGEYVIVEVGDEVMLRKKDNILLFDPFFRAWKSS